MTLDESARIALAAAILLGLVFAVTLFGPAASALAVLVAGALIWSLLVARVAGDSRVSPVGNDTDDRYRAVLDGVADPLMLLAEARIVYANSAALTLFGSHIDGQDVRLAIRHPAIAAVLGDPEGVGSAEIGGLAGDPRIWEVRIAPNEGNRRLIHMVDRSARHSAERARVDFVANASHELRTPLANIGGYAETLADDAAGGDPATRARFVSIIASETKRLSALVEDLMALSRIEADKHAAPQTVVDLRPLAARVIAERRDAITLDAGDAAFMIRGDAVQLSQLLHNLNDNAAKYGTAGGGIINRLVHDDAGRICLSVIDQGAGIPAAHIPRLTERFYRVDAARSQSAGGTGLGLSIVKHIAERHRATLDIRSDIGKGTTVCVTFEAAVI